MARYPLTAAFLKVIEETARKHGAKRIDKIWLTAGKGMVFRGDASGFFEDILKGTAARDAEIYIKHGDKAGKCRCCGLVFGNEKDVTCPECGGMSDSIALDKRFIIDMMEVEK